MAKVSTQYFDHIFDEETSKNAFDFLEKNVPWEKGIYSKSKQQTSRYAYYHNPESNSTVDIFINNLVNIAMNKVENYKYYGVYLNYYRNGEDFCPNHSHKDTKQLVLSFGTSRTLTVGSKNYDMKSGDGILFGSSIHGIPKQPEITNGRISIAIFIPK